MQQIIYLFLLVLYSIITMNNQTKSISSSGFVISIGYLASIFSLLFILILILITLFLLFTKQKHSSVFDEHELPSGISSSTNERKSFQFRQSKQYSSTYPSSTSFQMDLDDQNTRSTSNLLSTK